MDRYEFLELLGEYFPNCGGWGDSPYVDTGAGTVSVELGSAADVKDHMVTCVSDDFCFVLECVMPSLVEDVVSRLARRVSLKFDWRKVWDSLYKFSDTGTERFNAALDDAIADDDEHRYRIYVQYETEYDKECRIYIVRPCYEFGTGEKVYLPSFEVPKTTLASRNATEQIIADHYGQWGLV